MTKYFHEKYRYSTRSTPTISLNPSLASAAPFLDILHSSNYPAYGSVEPYCFLNASSFVPNNSLIFSIGSSFSCTTLASTTFSNTDPSTCHRLFLQMFTSTEVYLEREHRTGQGGSMMRSQISAIGDLIEDHVCFRLGNSNFVISCCDKTDGEV